MDHLVVNHEDGVSAEVYFDRNDRFRVVMRDLDADAVIGVRIFPNREQAVAWADQVAA